MGSTSIRETKSSPPTKSTAAASAPGCFASSGTVSMARSSDPNSAGSQFFIVHSDHADFLDGQYTVFGKVEEGLDVREIVEPYIREVLPGGWIGRDTEWHVNPTGKFVIGGPDGVADNCKRRADFTWSLSQLTLPHGLARVLFAEQLYRAHSLHMGHPYHRE